MNVRYPLTVRRVLRRLGDCRGGDGLGLLRLPEEPVGRGGGGRAGGDPVADDGHAGVGRSGRLVRGGLLVEDDGPGAAEKKRKKKFSRSFFPFRRHPKV